MFHFLSHAWTTGVKWLASWRFRAQKKTAAIDVIEPQTIPLPEVVTEPPALRSIQRPNRATRRAYERARRKKDKFVTPKGPQPVPQKRAARPARSLPMVVIPESSHETAELNIADVHDDGSPGDILYDEREFYGEFTFRDTILDQLDRYFFYLQRMKDVEPDTFGLYKNIGATIVPYLATHKGERRVNMPEIDEKLSPEEIATWKAGLRVPDYFNLKRPSFGCIAYGTDPVTEEYEQQQSEAWRKRAKLKNARLFVPRFMYFVKYDRPPPTVEMVSDGDVYSVTLWWDRPNDPDPRFAKHKGVPTEFCVFVGDDGRTIRALRVLSTTRRAIKASKTTPWERKTDRKGERGVFVVPDRRWKIPDEFERWGAKLGVDGSLFLAHMFCDVAMMYEHSNLSMIRVSVHKGDLAATFNVDARRMPYFFQDRDSQLTVAGAKKRIFHIVKPHSRETAKGTSNVKMHFRGLREFEWAGYRVSVTVPGLDHFMLPDFNVGMDDEHWVDPSEGILTSEVIGERLAKNIRSGLGSIAKIDWD